MQIFLLGGSDADGNHLSLVTAYDAVLEESLNFTGMPQPRAHAATATDNATIWVVGGYSADADEDASTPGGCLLAYSVAADRWTTGDCMQTPRADACASFVAGKLYVAGGARPGLNGCNQSPAALQTIGIQLSARTRESRPQNMYTACWRGPPPHASATEQQPCSTAAGLMLPTTECPAGGSTTGGAPVASIEAYDPSTNAWSTLSSSLAASATLVTCAVLNNSVLVVAGGTCCPAAAAAGASSGLKAARPAHECQSPASACAWRHRPSALIPFLRFCPGSSTMRQARAPCIVSTVQGTLSRPVA